jgi:hypothetical protein
VAMVVTLHLRLTPLGKSSADGSHAVAPAKFRPSGGAVLRATARIAGRHHRGRDGRDRAAGYGTEGGPKKRSVITDPWRVSYDARAPMNSAPRTVQERPALLHT